MERKKLWKRGLSFGLALVMALSIGISPLPEGLFTLTANAAEKTFSLPKSDLALGMNVIPNALANDKNFMNSYVRKGSMSLNSYFTVSSQSNSTKGSGALAYTDKITRDDKGSTWYTNFRWNNITAQQRELLERTDYDFRYEGNVISDNHEGSYWSGLKKHTHARTWDYVEVGLSDPRGTKFTKQSTHLSSGVAQAVDWSTNSLQVNAKDGTTDYWLEFYAKTLSENCKCGAAATSGNVFYMVDTSAPRITDTYICTDPNNPSGSKVNSGGGFSASSVNTNYIVFEFSEDVRFSDNTGKEISLNLDAYDAITGVALDAGTIKAKLISFVDNRMIFEYSVPTTINGKPTNIYITGVSSKQDELANGSFSLKLYNGNGDLASTGNQKSTCYITDIAGNSLDWNSSDKWSGRVYYDNVAPIMNDISMNGNMMVSSNKESTDGVDRSSIYAGEGDWVEFTVSFNENVKINTSGQMYMVLNVKDPNGDFIELSCSKNGNNSIKSLRLSFTAGMLAANMAGQKVYVTGIEGITSITDSAGNVMTGTSDYTANLSKISPHPKQHVYVDTDKPVIATSLTADGQGVYAPITTSVGSGEYITFPIIISENVENTALENTSQVEPQKAGFALVQDLAEGQEGMNFGWYVDYEQNIDTSKFQSGITVSETASKYTYTPVNGETAYLHMKFDKNSTDGYRISTDADASGIFVDADIYVTITDNAGNTQEATFPITHQIDHTEPTGNIKAKVDKKIDYTALKSSMTSDFDVKDDFGIKKIQYYWTYTTTNESGVEETKNTDIQTIDLSSSLTKEYTVSTTLEIPFDIDGNYGRSGSASLTVTYEDFAGYSGSVTSATHTFDFTLADAVYEVVSGTKANPINAPKIYLSAPASSASTTSETLVFIPYGVNAIGATLYFVYEPSFYKGTDLDLLGEIIKTRDDTGAGTSPAYGKWYAVTGTIADGAGDFYICDPFSYYSSYYHVMRKYFYGEKGLAGEYGVDGVYGEQEIIFVTSSNFADDKSFTQAESTVETVTTHLANNVDYTAGITGLRDGESADAVSKYCYDTTNTEATPATDLAGLEIELTLSNTTAEEAAAAYGFTLLDFSSSTVELLYYGKYDNLDSGASSAEVVHTWNGLAKAATQSVVVPEGVATKTGWYGIRVNLVTTEGRVIDPIVMEQYYLMDCDTVDMSLDSYKKTYYRMKEDNVYQTVVAESETKDDWGENPSLEIALNMDAGENWTSECAFTFSKGIREYAKYYYGINENVKVRVYNKNDANYDTNAIWINANDMEELVYVPVAVEEITAESYGTAENLLLPLFDGDNLICYEIVNTNGVTYSHDVPVYVYAECEDWDINIEYTEISERTGGVMEIKVSPEVTENIDLANSEFMCLDKMDAADSFSFREDGEYEFMLLDQNGNLSIRTYTAEGVDGRAPYYVGTTTGTAYDADTDYFYHFQVYAYDYDNAISADELMLTFDADYSAVLLGLTGDARINNTDLVTMKVPINRETDENGEYLPWESYAPGNNGIYRTRLIKEGPEEYEINGTTGVYPGYINVEIWGTWKYDEAADPNVNPDTYEQYTNASTRTLTFSVVDANGNCQTGSRSYPDGSYRNYYNYDYQLFTASFYEDGSTILDWDAETGESLPLLDEEGRYAIYSYVPLSGIYSYGASQLKEVETDWPGNTFLYTTLPMIQEDGEYTIELMDLFGDTYEKTIVVDEFGSLGVSASFSEVNSTNQPVTVNVAATLEGDYITSIVAETIAGEAIEGTISTEDATKAAIILPENGVVTVTTNLGKERKISVENIDKTLEAASVVYVDSLGVALDGTESTLDEEVTAIVKCSENIEGIDGELSYTFPRGSSKGDTHTFMYKDMAGNEGEVTAVLPCDISEVEKEEVFTDTTAPAFDMSVYGMRNSKYYLITKIPSLEDMKVEAGVATEESTVFSEALSEDIKSYKAQSYKLVLDIDDETDTKIVVQETGTAAPTSYEAVETGSTATNISVSGNAIIIDENKTFDVHIIDEFNNVTSVIGINIHDAIDKEAPKYSVTYIVSDDKKSVRALFLPENPLEELEVIYPLESMESIKLESSVQGEDGIYLVDRYFHTFTENGTKTFNYKDEYGNKGNVEASVQGFSNIELKVSSEEWLTTGEAPTSESTKINKDIVVKLNLSKKVSNVALYEYDATKENGKGALLDATTPVSMNFTDLSVYITYTGNVDKWLVVELTEAENGKVVYYTIKHTVECIDKAAPVITVKSAELAENKRFMTITFEADENVVLSESVKVDKQTKKAVFGETHTWMARDNKEKVLHFVDEAGNVTEYTVTENSAVDMTTLTAVYSATEDHTDETTNPAQDFAVEAGDSIWIKTNKAVEVAFDDGASTSVSANSWTELVLPETEGVYMIKLTDSNTKEVSYKTLSVQVKDSLAPDITLESNTIVLEENVAVAEMINAIRSGVSIWDNKDGEISTYEVAGYPQSVESGLYELTYRTSDSAGNVTSIDRTLYIMDEDMTVLYVNGIPALPFGRTVLEERDLSFETNGFGDESLLTIKIRSGIKSAGQMKRYTKTIENMETSVSEGGFYTIYVRTQERAEYVTYLYVEE